MVVIIRYGTADDCVSVRHLEDMAHDTSYGCLRKQALRIRQIGSALCKGDWGEASCHATCVAGLRDEYLRCAHHLVENAPSERGRFAPGGFATASCNDDRGMRVARAHTRRGTPEDSEAVIPVLDDVRDLTYLSSS